MFLTAQQVTSMTEKSLTDFLELAVQEGLYVDYKEALCGASDRDQKREFLKDVTAFANAAGGTLLLGVREPATDQTAAQQIVGLDKGESIATNLERLASSSIDPRIPGLRIVPVPLSAGKACIVVHIPQSLSRPHMVSHDGHKSFYVRHSESSFPMTTHEIREAVLTSATAEGRTRALIARKLADVRQDGRMTGGKPAFFLQAAPLIPPEPAWDVLSEPFENVVRGINRQKKSQYYATLESNMSPRPTIDGLLGQDQRHMPSWQTEIHRTGYLSLFYWDIQTHPDNPKCHMVHSNTCDIFKAFCDMLKESLEVSATDVPYLISCAYLNAADTCIWSESHRGRHFSEVYGKPDIIWPEHFRAAGADPMAVAERLILEMFNAFGFKEIVR